MKYTINDAERGDTPAILALLMKVFDRNYSQFLDVEKLAQCRQRIGSRVPDGADFYRVVRHEGDIIGYIWADIERDGSRGTGWEQMRIIYVHELHVDPDYQRCGVGRALMHELEAYVRDHNIDYIALDCHQHNQYALRFYAQLGFRSISYNDTHVQLYWVGQ